MAEPGVRSPLLAESLVPERHGPRRRGGDGRAGVLVLGTDIVVSFPYLVDVLRDPASHEAQDAGMVAVFVLIPIAIIGIACLASALLLWPTRAGGAALATASAVVVMVWGNLGGIPSLVPAIGVATAGALLTLWLVYRDWAAGSDRLDRA